MNNNERIEALGPAERIINTLINGVDHLVHNRPGMVVADNRSAIGVKWYPVTHKREGNEDVVYRLTKIGRKTQKTRVGIRDANNVIRSNGRVVGEYRKPGIYKEVAAYLYKQVADIWEMDNEFVARWASWAFAQEYRDLKVVLAAFSLVQSRSGAPIREDGEILFYDDDYRETGEAMCLIRRRDNKDLNPKLLLRVGDLLRLPEIAALNRELGFTMSARNPALGRYNKAVTKWLRYRENNLPMLKGLVRAGFRKTVIALAQRVGYKPESSTFFEVLRWKQKQSADGRRTIAIGAELAKAETWAGLSEREICQKIISDKPSFKRVGGLLGTSDVGLTRAVMAAAIQAGSLSDNDLIIMTPTLEELGLLNVQTIRDRWETATRNAENLRAANIAKRLRKVENAEVLTAAADAAAKKALEEVTNDMRVYVIVDKSASMDGAIDKAKRYCATFLQGIPLDRLHVSIFNTSGRELKIRHGSAAGVEQAFRGHRASGGTNYASGVNVLAKYKPKAEEDAVMIFVGDQADSGHQNFAPTVRNSGINPVAFGLIEVVGNWGYTGKAVENTATALGIPCFRIEEDTFNDPYACTRTIRNLIAATPVGAAPNGARKNRKTLVEQILETELLSKPAWA